MPNEPIENLVLPRLDWHDSEGRINKDALIDNFNAIEAKINELANISAFTINVPDFSTFNYDDTTLQSPDYKVINLKSFVDIMHLKGFPLVCTFDGKVLKKLQYYNDNYRLVTITDVDLSSLGTDNKNLIYLDYSEDMAYISDDITNTNGDVLIACYDNGVVYSIGDMGLIDINIVELCSRLKDYSQEYTVNRRNENGARITYNRNSNRLMGYTKQESKGRIFNMTIRDFGKELED